MFSSGKMIYGDDDSISNQDATEEEADLVLDGNTEARIFNSMDAPMKETPFKVLLELKGVGSEEGGRSGVDLVTILDTRRTENRTKISEMKLAMRFLLKKLGHTDRLSLVTCNNGEANRICPLRQITVDSVMEISNQVDALVAGSTTHTEEGLKMALKILDDRTLITRRRCAVMLMSDNIEDDRSDAVKVPVSKVPVYTFGFGRDSNPELLRKIADKSCGGVFVAVPGLDNSTFAAFSTPLAGLLGVLLKDLTLTIIPLSDSNITEVNAENYPQIVGNNSEPVTIKFGSLYNGETRKVLAKLTLPEVKENLGTNILRVVYKYRVVGGEEKLESDERILTVRRTNILLTVKEKDEQEKRIEAEEKRIEAAGQMEKATSIVSDAEKLEQAKEEIVELNKKLEHAQEELTRVKKDNLAQATKNSTLEKQISELMLKEKRLILKIKTVTNKNYKGSFKKM